MTENKKNGIPLSKQQMELSFFNTSSRNSEDSNQDFLSESESFEMDSEDELLVQKERVFPLSFFSDSSTSTSTSVSPLLLKKEIPQRNRPQITYAYEEEKAPKKESETKIIFEKNAKITTQGTQNHATPRETQGSTQTFSIYSYTPTYTSISTSPIRFKNTLSRHKDASKRMNVKKFKVTQVDKSSYGEYDEEEDVMNSSDRRFIADSSQYDNDPILYRLIDRTQTKPKHKIKVNEKGELVNEYSVSTSEDDITLSEE